MQLVKRMFNDCVHHFDPRHTANDVSIIRRCDQWIAVVCGSAILQHDRLFQLIIGVKLPAAV